MTQPPTLSGLGGIGKTQTVLEYAHRYKDEYDAVLWVPADTREALVGKLAEFAALLGLPNHTDPNQLRQAKDVKQWLETQKKLTWLVIFDNVDDLAMVAEFLPTTGRGAILLTTRAHAVGNHLKKIELEKLSLKESVEFLLGRIGKKGYAGLNAFTETERPAAEYLCSLMDGLPLALDQAAAYIEEHRCTLAEYVSLYERQRVEFLRFRNSVDTRDYPDSVATTWHLSFQQIQASPAATDLLHLLAFLHPDVIHLKELLRQKGAELTPSLKAMAKDTALLESAIDLVQKYSLVRYNAETGTLSIHRMVQAVIQDRLEETERRSWAERAMLIVSAVFPEPRQGAWRQCERMLPHVLLVAHSIEYLPISSEKAVILLLRAASYLNERARYAEAEPLFRRALDMREQFPVSVSPTLSEVLNGLATLYLNTGKYDEGQQLYRRALDLYERQPEYSGMGVSLNGMGSILVNQGKFREAESFLRRALDLLENQPEQTEMTKPLNNLAVLYQYQGKYEQAEPLYLRALQIYQQQRWQHPRMAYTLSNLGAMYKDMGRYREAEPLLQRALHLCVQKMGAQHHGVAYPLSNLASLYVRQGNYTQAKSIFLRALTICEQVPPLHEHPDLADPLCGLGTLYREQGQYEEAEPLYRRALSICEQAVGSEYPETAEILHEFARSQELWGKREEAQALYERAHAVRTEALGEDHPKTKETRQHLLNLREAMRRLS